MPVFYLLISLFTENYLETVFSDQITNTITSVSFAALLSTLIYS
ncbi:hypothetical protein Slin_6069 [Spirosoma linguale DSM 74]|uniref:Uncharacterized protein n=1 Tax=Spirosoma linguale (strain ATCC 33905 / DSM 74 / LMG 10896 / Claus 1) TaxID=504472 RepID=D2QT99_SPILD|nr:hypothetical protein Slin_6069 [Spirosoma linguale DSM 74]